MCADKNVAEALKCAYKHIEQDALICTCKDLAQTVMCVVYNVLHTATCAITQQTLSNSRVHENANVSELPS